MDFTGNLGFAFLLTILAGLSTAVGGSVVFFMKKLRPTLLSFAIGFSAGVMVYVSFVELLPHAIETINPFLGVAAFFFGILIMSIIDIIVPEVENPHSYKGLPALKEGTADKVLMRTGALTAVAIAVHNFPEGLATFTTALSDINLGIIIALAIAIHNIPEGISLSIPVYYASKSKTKAFLYSLLAGVAEPFGAVIAFLILLPFLSPFVVASLLAFAGGIMVYIAVDELLPIAHQYGQDHIVIWGFIYGMIVMAISLLLL